MNSFDSIVIQGDLRVIGDVSGAFVNHISSTTGPNFNSVGTPTVTPTISNGRINCQFDYMKGVCGPRGVCGPQGSTGDTGLRGFCGPIGASGLPGPFGFCGPSGAVGSIGNTGPCGPVGGTGSTGPTGSNGVMGSSIVTSISYENHSSMTVSKSSLSATSWYNIDSWGSTKRIVYDYMTFSNMNQSTISYLLFQITNSVSGLDAQMGIFLHPYTSTGVMLTFDTYNQNYRMNLKKFDDSLNVSNTTVIFDWINFNYG